MQGPGRASGTAKIFKYVLNSSLPIMIKNNISVVDIDDCANGHLLGAIKGVDGERYILNSFSYVINRINRKIKGINRMG